MVTRFDDPAPTGCSPTDCSLREALILANVFNDADRILLGAGTYNLSIVGADENEAQAGDLDITTDVTIVGAGSAQTIVRWPFRADRVFDVVPVPFDAALQVKLAGMTITGGGAAGDIDPYGGGINAVGDALDVQLTDVVLDDNAAGRGGGAHIYAQRIALDLVRATNNRATYNGGIEALLSTGDQLSITGLTVIGNQADRCGGASIMAANDTGTHEMLLSNLVFQGNFADRDGGGLCTGSYRHGIVIANSVFDGNAAGGIGAGNAGGILVMAISVPGPSWGTALDIRSSEITNNTANGDGGGIGFGSDAQGTDGDCRLTIESSTIAHNAAAQDGGGLDVEPTFAGAHCQFHLLRTRVEANDAVNDGGGVLTDIDTAIVVESTLLHNTAHIGGGLHVAGGIVVVSRSTFAFNDGATYGGAIETFADALAIDNSTFYANTSPYGATLDNNGKPIQVFDSTLVATTGTTGSVYANYISSQNGKPEFVRTILAGTCQLDHPVALEWNIGAPGTSCDFGGTSIFDVPYADLALGDLADNGGATPTMLPQAGSVAIGFVTSGECPSVDQRGFLRSAPCDAGAVESDGTDVIFADGFD
ncbi:MAG TPA: choice-of-anchor Q domain-containing protein [Rhodanobacteraceae bacterium]|nr:choice-of-anchor Q domain-containing protein [Rhodanobacteraceae bacterium]